jgi:hypothetical protein
LATSRRFEHLSLVERSWAIATRAVVDGVAMAVDGNRPDRSARMIIAADGRRPPFI